MRHPAEGIEAIIAGLDWTGALSRRVVAVMHGYFDDSGTDRTSPVAVMAGYVANEHGWKLFEQQTKKLFSREGIPFFRAKLFHHGEKQFKGWSDARKLRFATEWFGYAGEHVLRGVSAAADARDLKSAKAQHRSASSISVQYTCMSMATTLLCKDVEVWEHVKKDGLSLVIEKSGAPDNSIKIGLEHLAAANEELGEVLRTTTFADKESVRALQLADYLAYFSYQLALTARHGSTEGATEFLNIALRAVPTLKEIGHSFFPNAAFASAAAQAKAKAKKTKPS
jgi:hypothetical protein